MDLVVDTAMFINQITKQTYYGHVSSMHEKCKFSRNQASKTSATKILTINSNLNLLR